MEKELDQTSYSYSSSQYEHPVHVPTKPKGDKSILDELNQYRLRPEIKQKAQRIFLDLGRGTHRGNKRKQLLFYCIYSAELEYHNEHPEIEEDVDPGIIRKLVGISHGSMRRAMSMFSEVQTGYRPKTGEADPLGMIRGYCLENHMSEELVEPIKELGKQILNKDSKLKEEYPQTVAAGLIKYCLTTMGVEIDNKSFSKNVNLSEATINSMYKRIAKVDNMEV